MYNVIADRRLQIADFNTRMIWNQMMDAGKNSSLDAAKIMSDLFTRCRTKAMSILELFQTAERLQNSGLLPQSVELYKNWVAYNCNSPHLHLAYFNFAVVLRAANDLPGSIQALQFSIKTQEDFAQSHINLGRALEDSGLIGDAVAQWRRYLEMPGDVTAERLSHRMMAMQHVGRVLEANQQLVEAEEILWDAMELRPDKKESAQHWIAIRQRQCKWPPLKTSEHVSMRHLIEGLSPMTLACYLDDPIFQMAKAYRYCKSLVGPVSTEGLTPCTKRNKLAVGQKIRIGYVSSDLREHAVGFALSELFEHHDTSKFEFYAYYCGEPKQNDPTQSRLKRSMNHWIDINAMTDVQAADRIKTDEIDILVDVNGFTKSARTKIFAYRPAPVIVSFCGYPGTLGSPYHQYLIADDFIVPPENEIFYTEKVLRITCNQPVDRKRLIGTMPMRSAYGLPENAVVFACFNGMQKVTQACFKRWMDILKAVPNSVLWLLEGGNQVDERLKGIAAENGIGANRLIFAGKVPNPDHLARIALADLFLDTFPYGAHSTGSDAITMGLPVLTFAGNGFAARFCASIVNAAGMPSLIVDTPEAYVQTAIRLGNQPAQLQAIREELAQKRDACVLRDIPAMARSLEDCFVTMQSDCENGTLPVPDFRNMEVYYEIGSQILEEGFDYLSFDDLIAKYQAKLVAFNNREPLPRDNRLWIQG
jgi:predicted O-linked N-acetylglucosamine transferase (SPINDLY family)